jgi:hypothetical protein
MSYWRYRYSGRSFEYTQYTKPTCRYAQYPQPQQFTQQEDLLLCELADQLRHCNSHIEVLEEIFYQRCSRRPSPIMQQNLKSAISTVQHPKETHQKIPNSPHSFHTGPPAIYVANSHVQSRVTPASPPVHRTTLSGCPPLAPHLDFTEELCCAREDSVAVWFGRRRKATFFSYVWLRKGKKKKKK